MPDLCKWVLYRNHWVQWDSSKGFRVWSLTNGTGGVRCAATGMRSACTHTREGPALGVPLRGVLQALSASGSAHESGAACAMCGETDCVSRDQAVLPAWALPCSDQSVWMAARRCRNPMWLQHKPDPRKGIHNLSVTADNA